MKKVALLATVLFVAFSCKHKEEAATMPAEQTATPPTPPTPPTATLAIPAALTCDDQSTMEAKVNAATKTLDIIITKGGKKEIVPTMYEDTTSKMPFKFVSKDKKHSVMFDGTVTYSVSDKKVCGCK